MELYIEHQTDKFNEAFGIPDDRREHFESVINKVVIKYVTCGEEYTVTHAYEEVVKECNNTQELHFAAMVFWGVYNKTKSFAENPFGGMLGMLSSMIKD